jgi:hypothetical protein
MAPYSNQTFSNTGWNMAGIQQAVNVNCQLRDNSEQNAQSICQVIVLKKLLVVSRAPRLPSGKTPAIHFCQ